MTTRLLSALAALMLASLLAQSSWAQEVETRTLRPRRLAPGVLTAIPPDRDEGDTFSGPRPLLEVTKTVDPSILDWTPNYSPKTNTLGFKASRVVFRRSVWYLDFAFKPLRMIYVDIPQPSGKFQRTPVWYLVYRIRNPGYHLSPKEGHFAVEGAGAGARWVEGPDKFGHTQFGVDEVNHTVRFFPRFVLFSHDYNKRYLDQLIPLAVPAIQQREDPAIKLHDSVSITEVNIPVSDERVDRSVWGVATWMNLDPKMDFFSIYVQGLTNAYKFEDNPDAFTRGSPPLTGRRIRSKTLQLCFWRPGDAVLESEKEVRYGMPTFTDEVKKSEMLELYGVEKKIDHRWFYP